MVGKYKTKLPCPNFPTTRGNGQGRTDATLLLPSSGQNVQHEKARQSGPVLNDNAKCVMKDLRCVTHDCIVKKVKVKDKRWGYIDRKKQFGWKHSSRKRCVSGWVG